MSPSEIFALRDHLGPELKGRTISDARQLISLTDILSQTCLGGRIGELAGRNVLLALSGQLLSALAMIELDGVATRMLLCPPDLNADHIKTLVEDAGIDAVVTDRPEQWVNKGVGLIAAARLPPLPRSMPGANLAKPCRSLRARIKILLLRAIRTTSTSASGWVVLRERTWTNAPSSPMKLESPKSETTNHWLVGFFP